MSELPLIGDAVAAAGGLERWQGFSFVSATMHTGGSLWALKGQGVSLDGATVEAALDQEWVSHFPFAANGARCSVTPERVELRNAKGKTVEALERPEEAFLDQTFDTPWTRLQLAYFMGIAMWTYLTQPFCFTFRGFKLHELGPGPGDQPIHRRLAVEWPPALKSLSPKQTLYLDDDAKVIRHDYTLDLLAGVTATHIYDHFVEISGITIPTKHRVFRRDPDGHVDTETLILGVDLRDISLA